MKYIKKYKDGSKQNESINTKKRAKIVVALNKAGIRADKEYTYSGGFMANDMEVAQDIADALAGEYTVVIHDDKKTKSGKIEVSIGEAKVTEATVRGNEGLPGEDDRDGLLNTYSREMDDKLSGTNINSLFPEMGRIQRDLQTASRGKESELQAIATDVIKGLYEGVLPDDMKWDIQLVNGGGDIKDFLDEMEEKSNKQREEKEEDEDEREEEENEEENEEEEEQEERTPQEIERSVKLAIDKRKLANNIIQGEALNVKAVVEMPECKDAIKQLLGDQIGDKFVADLLRLSEIAGMLDWQIPVEHKANMMENSPQGFAGAAHVDWDNEEEEEGGEEGEENSEENGEQEDPTPTLRVRGVDFVMLIHESVKAIYEYLATPGISDDPEIAQAVKQNTSSFADEAEEFKFGPLIAGKLRDFINSIEGGDKFPNTREHIFINLMRLDDEDFLDLMKGILSDTPSARNRMTDMVSEFASQMEQYEKDLREWEMNKKFSSQDDNGGGESNDGGESEMDKMIRLATTGSEEKEEEQDESELSTSEIRSLIDDALDAGDFKEVDRLSKMIKESQFFVILENYIEKKKK
jgi:hypothetical protein